MTYPSSFILLLIFVIASLYPLLNIQEWVKESRPMTAMVTLYTENVMPQLVISPQETSTTWQELLPQVMSATYWGVVLILSLRFLVQLASIIRLRLRSHKALIEGRQVYLLTKESSPFSFGGYSSIPKHTRRAKSLPTRRHTYANGTLSRRTK